MENPSPYYQNETSTIFHGDSLEILNTHPKNSVALVITSPPYNVGKEYGDEKYQANDSKDYWDYLAWLDKIWIACQRVLVPGGRLCINVNDQGRNPYYPIHADITIQLRRLMKLLGIIVWDKQNPLGTTSWGSWQSASAPVLRGRHEYIIVAEKWGEKRSADGRESGPWERKEFLTYTQETWFFTPQTSSNHPAPFPYELPKRLIKLYSFLGDTILDPFMGSGTTLRAAQDLGRLGIGVDIVEKYCKIAKNLLAHVHLPGLAPAENQTQGERNYASEPKV